MKIQINILLLLLAVFTLNTSCEGDLDVTPNDPELLLEDEFFADSNSYTSLLAGVYANLSLSGLSGAGSSNIGGLDAGTGQYIRGLYNLQNLSTDESIFTFENDPGIRGIQRGTWDAENPLILGVFARASFSVTLANEFLRQTTDELLDSRGVSDDLRQDITQFRAEARVLRALSYYHLLDMFGKAAFVTENDVIGSATPPQEIVGEELFNFIETELLEAQTDLAPALQNEYGRADQGVAKMILAKLYLNAEVYTGTNRYTDCLNICEELIGSGYTLTPNYLDNFLADNNTNGAQNEIMLPSVNDGLFAQNFGGTTILVQGQVGKMEQNGESLGVSAGGFGGLFRLRREFSQLFEDGLYNNDQRNSLITSGRPISVQPVSEGNNGYILTKYSNRTSTGEQGSDLTFSDADFPIFRFADVYLMYAEAHLRGGGGSLDLAVGYINELRERAFGSTQGNITNSQLTLDFIIVERARELHWESHRRQDLIRFGLFTGNQYVWEYKGDSPDGASIEATRTLYPIPSSSIATNPNLIQNPGY